MSNVYYNPEDFGLTTIGEVEYSSGCYEFDLIVLWKRSDGVFVTARDSGCSCPSPFEDHNLTTLEPVHTLAELRERLRAANGYYDRTARIDQLLTLAREAGLR